MKHRLVSKPEQALENIVRFQQELLTNKKRNSLVDTMSHFRAWYAIQHKGEWIFAPSKFIGYMGFTADAYGANNRQIDGRATEVVLRPWFTELSHGELAEQLQEKLGDFCASFGKQTNSLARISVLSEEFDGDDQPKIGWVDAMLALYREMPTEAQQEFRRRLKND
ncbi:hypothetical protein I6G66_06000 [Delftia acidovorans]|uniref:Uncharacterized protein n=1 Tax=Delftia acidovorans TaxID=80866 RepID=A0A7T2S641_DELAC|nr:hypothetical protein [Delftia acidovorans]QPS09572.1 hypothetical protein I6G66_06000 [Delftia acidovorans]